MKNQTLTRKELLDSLNFATCKSVQDKIKQYLANNTLKFDYEDIQIDEQDIKMLYDKASSDTIQYFESLGIEKPVNQTIFIGFKDNKNDYGYFIYFGRANYLAALTLIPGITVCNLSYGRYDENYYSLDQIKKGMNFRNLDFSISEIFYFDSLKELHEWIITVVK